MTEEGYLEFIIGVDNNIVVSSTCNHNLLSNNFINRGTPHYLTLVFFNPEVLRKYYDISRYKIEDGLIKYGSEWAITFGINKEGLVHAWLGDLGRDLPFEEQCHWRQYNVLPKGGIGDTTLQREILGRFAEPDDLTQIFKNEFDDFSKLWKLKNSWDLFLPLNEADKHNYKNFHAIILDDQAEFDQQILALAKILPDSINLPELKKEISLNESEIKKILNISEKDQLGSISRFEALLIDHFKLNNKISKKIVKPLRLIQALRSGGAAHRKGKSYEKLINKLDLKNKSLKTFFEELLNSTIDMFKQINEVLKGITDKTKKNFPLGAVTIIGVISFLTVLIVILFYLLQLKIKPIQF